MRIIVLAATLTMFVVPATAEAKGDVTMYGASWCGPCRAVKGALDQNRIPYRYVDIDSEAGRADYKRARGSSRGIPLLVIGSTKIVGANFAAIGQALQKNGLTQGAPAQPQKGEYGGKTAGWWQSQFRSMRGYEAQLKQQIDQLAAVAADDVDKGRLAAMRDKHEVVKASIQQLENDASRASVPRKYRR